MQSGIKASQELKDAFNSLVSSSSSFAVVVTIESETLQPVTTIPSSSGFPSDLSAVQAELSPNVARYVLVRRSDAPDGFVGITYVPDSAPVRQKMLFASTRLTLIRELGLERFGETIFCTTKEEVSEEGWKKHEKHRQMDNPLTEEERANQELRDAESLEQGGTMRRHGHYTDDNGSAGQSGMATPTTSAAGKLAMKTGQGVLEALKGLQSAGAGALVQIKIDVATETLELAADDKDVAPSALATTISSQDPRYSFYAYSAAGGDQPKVLFIYTCPSASKIKERMVYAASRANVVALAERDAGIVIAKRLEGTGPDDFDEKSLAAEFVEHKEETKGFARPKRPGRR